MTLQPAVRFPDTPRTPDPHTDSGAICVVAMDPTSPDPSPLVSAAAQYAPSPRARTIVLGVVHPRTLGGETGPSPEEARTRAALSVTAAQLRREGLDAAPLLRAGPLASTVADTAVRHRASLVILGSTRSGRGGFGRWLTRSPGDAITRSLSCPTLWVKATDGGTDADRTGAVVSQSAVRGFDADLARVGPAVPHSLGERTVEVARIVGSVGRVGSLDDDFRDRRAGARGDARFGRLLDMAERGDTLPPVDLYKIGYGYYLLDGHRRVAAARALGQVWIDATVVEFVPIADEGARSAVAARRAFERSSGVTQIDAALPDTYPCLERLVRDFGRRHGFHDPHEAGARWYARAFRPERARLRAARAHERFPGHHTADIVAALSAGRAAAPCDQAPVA